MGAVSIGDAAVEAARSWWRQVLHIEVDDPVARINGLDIGVYGYGLITWLRDQSPDCTVGTSHYNVSRANDFNLVAAFDIERRTSLPRKP